MSSWSVQGCVDPVNDMQPEMTSEALADLLHLFENAGIVVWLDGGWAVDAVLGEQSRPHKDVDIILRVADLPALRDVLGSKGFEIRAGGTESNFVLANRPHQPFSAGQSLILCCSPPAERLLRRSNQAQPIDSCS